MSNPTERAADWARQGHRFMSELVNAWAHKLATWLIVGNAGALVLAFNAIIGGTTCDPSALGKTLIAFAVGLLLAFAGAAVNYLNGLFASALVTQVLGIITDIETSEYHRDRLSEEGNAEGVEGFNRRIADAGIKMAPYQKRMRWVFAGTGIAIALFIASAISFATGLLLPVFGGELLIQSCRGVVS